MSKRPTSDVTGLFVAWQHGDEGAVDRLPPLVYGELHRLAHAQMSREPEANTLQTTALVHEAYLRLVDVRHVSWHVRAHFLAARLMRRIHGDRARARRRARHGGGTPRVLIEDWLDWKATRLWLLHELTGEPAGGDRGRA
jgi:RNA polymerase sigma factor (TIGR02999 family)